MTQRTLSLSIALSELSQAASADLHGQLAQLSGNVKFDSRLNFFGAESLLLGVDHQISSLLHESLKEFHDNLVDQFHRVLGDSKLWLHFFQYTVDVGLEGI